MPDFAPMQSATLGNFKVTYLPDGGGVADPVASYPASTAEAWQAYTDLLNEEGQFLTSIGGFLIETGERKIIVDTGIGPVSLDFPGIGNFSGGRYLDSLAQSGVAPEAVTDVIFTHMHVDHVGWTTVEVDGQRRLTFPNARHRVSAAEWNLWHGGDNPAGPDPETVQKPLEGRLEMLADGDVIVPGLSVLATPGHTPGHLSLLITAGEQRLYLTADVFFGVMQLQQTGWNIAFDADPVQAQQTREELLAELLKPHTLAGINHFSNRVFGRVVNQDGVVSWQPLSQ